MFDVLIPICIVSTVCFFLYKLFELSVRKKERMRLMELQRENFEASHLNDSFLFPKSNVSSPNKKSYGSLKAGCLLLGLGFGFLAAWLLNLINLDPYLFEFDNYQINAALNVGQEMIYFGSVLFFGGMGLIVAFVIEQKMRKKDNREKTHQS